MVHLTIYQRFETQLINMIFKIIFKTIVECLNTAPIMKACHVTGIGALIPEEVCNPARDLCQGLLKKLVTSSGFETEVTQALKNISDETITKIFSGLGFQDTVQDAV